MKKKNLLPLSPVQDKLRDMCPQTVHSFWMKRQALLNRKWSNVTFHLSSGRKWEVENGWEQIWSRIGYFFRTNFNAHFNTNMYVTLSSTCFGPWHAHLQEEQLYKHSIWYPRSTRRLHTIPVESGHVEDNVTYMFILKCALKLVLKNILYYDARSEKHQITVITFDAAIWEFLQRIIP